MITIEQAIPGLKVKIPTTKTGSYCPDLAKNKSICVERAAQKGQDFLYITGCAQGDVICADTDYAWSGDYFSPADLDFYQEAAAPLPNADDMTHALFGSPMNSPITPAPVQGKLKQVQDDFLPIKEVFRGLEAIMRYKNQQYGNTGLQGIGIFSKANTLEKLLARADDKIARINNSPKLRKNDVADLAGYLVLICAHQEWFDFSDQQDQLIPQLPNNPRQKFVFLSGIVFL